MKLLNIAPCKPGDKVRGYWTGGKLWTVTQIEYRRNCWHINVAENGYGWWMNDLREWEVST